LAKGRREGGNFPDSSKGREEEEERAQVLSKPRTFTNFTKAPDIFSKSIDSLANNTVTTYLIHTRCPFPSPASLRVPPYPIHPAKKPITQINRTQKRNAQSITRKRKDDIIKSSSKDQKTPPKHPFVP
jgi:hypothetical protein